MDDKRFIIIIAIGLLSFSFIIYLIQYLIFKDIEHIFSYFLLHLAFVPIEVLLVSIVIEEILEYREKKKNLKKLNMIIGSFFGYVGEELLKIIVNADENIKNYLNISKDWNNKDYEKAKKLLKTYDYNINMDKIDLYKLKTLLENKRDFLLRLLENPILLEDDNFSELLLAVIHLSDELHKRDNLYNLPKSDLEHLKKDIIRVYKLLLTQWLNYLMHLKIHYPYIYSLCLRDNPINGKSVVICDKNEQ